jgi:4-amino-4-deoxy-L-arabinose transferase-like glycosyltransferase
LKHRRLILALIFTTGIAFRARDLLQPVNSTSWREGDEASIARNFDTEGLNILFPRIDWRGDGPGYAEMEFPIFPWLIGGLYRVFGFHEILGRLLALSFSLVSLVVFWKLASDLLEELAAAAALLFFALSPLTIHLATSLQPDGLMFLCYVTGAYTFWRWLRDGSEPMFWLALGSTTLAILAKASAAHIGILFALLLLSQRGLRATLSPRLWLFAAASLAPAVAWHQWAYGFWVEYGNSLGLSNGDHWVGAAALTNPSYVLGIARQELLFVWTETGWIIAGFAIVSLRSHRAVRICLYWLIAIGAFYLIAAGTTSELWARYYHVVAVPPVALLFGLGSQAAFQRLTTLGGKRFFAVSVLLLAAAIVTIRRTGMIGNWRLGDEVSAQAIALVGVLLAAATVSAVYAARRREMPIGRQALAVYFLAVAWIAAIFLEVHQLTYIYVGNTPSVLYRCAESVFSERIEPSSLIVASGGGCFTRHGRRGAYNASYFFYWLDRKGFNLCIEEQSLEQLRAFERRGARYFVAEEWALDWRPEFRRELFANFPLRAQCEMAVLFELPP